MIAAAARALNTKPIGYTGMGLGVGAIASYGCKLAQTLGDKDELRALYEAAVTHKDPTNAVGAVVAPAVAFLVAIVVALVLSYFGRPQTVASSAPLPDAPP